MQLTKGVLPLVIGNYAKNFGVSLYMYGHSAYTNGQQITIPRLNLNDPDSMEMAYGYVAHECGHIRYSDFGVLQGLNSTEILFGIFNALEDCRIEVLQVKAWPGLSKTFNFLVECLVPDLKKFNLNNKKNKNLATLLLMYCSFYVRFTENNNLSAADVLKQLKRILKTLVPESFVLALNELLQGTTSCINSKQVLEKAKKVLDFANNYVKIFNKKINDEQNIRNSSQDSDNLTTKNNDGINTKMPEMLLSEDDSLCMQRKIMQDIDFSDLCSKKILLDLANVSKIETLLPNLDEEFNTEIPKLVDKLSNKSYAVKATDDFGTTTPGYAKPAENSKLIDTVLEHLQLKNKLASLVKGYTEWFNGHRQRGSIINMYKYAMRKYTCSFDVFRKKVVHRELNTNIHLLVDISGSMSNLCKNSSCGRYEISNRVALSLAMALEGVKNIRSDVTYFPGNQNEFEIVSQHGDNIRQKAAYFDQKPKGCTPLSQSLMHAIEKFPKCDKLQRNIIIVVTDGEPDNPTSAKSIMEKAMESGVEIYAIRIGGVATLCNIFKNYEIINDAEELPNSMCTLLENALFNRKNIPV